MGFLKKFTKQELSWMMYDWANSAHSVIVVTILPIFFDSVAECTADSVSSMSTWGYATSIAMAIVALSAPFLGVFGDIRGMRKKLFGFFVGLGVLVVAGLAFTPPSGVAASGLNPLPAMALLWEAGRLDGEKIAVSSNHHT